LYNLRVLVPGQWKPGFFLWTLVAAGSVCVHWKVFLDTTLMAFWNFP
jgi:hypothetical protein